MAEDWASRMGGGLTGRETDKGRRVAKPQRDPGSMGLPYGRRRSIRLVSVERPHVSELDPVSSVVPQVNQVRHGSITWLLLEAG